MTLKELYNDWYPEYYDSIETQTYDYELMLELLGTPKKVLEICCGTGRVLLPLAKAGHETHGIDTSCHMLSRLMKKAEGVSNIHIQLDNVLTADWGTGFDVVLLAGNIIINIEGSEDYKADQQLLITKAYDALKPGGYLLMDNDGRYKPETQFKTFDIPTIRKIPTDSKGITAKRIFLWSKYDIKNQICTGKNLFELTTKEGKIFVKEKEYLKHIPYIHQMKQWVENAGFVIEHEWGDHYRNLITKDTNRAIYWARKP
ncbi:MAG: class I SAM-dependent methyltransferase [Clostridiales bacterium]|nr:class I SAM-dependent methyltransferase [Clostridiales bacterium]